METMTNHNSSNDNNDRNGYNVWFQLTQFELGPRQSKQNGLEDHPEYFKRCGYRVLWMINEKKIVNLSLLSSTSFLHLAPVEREKDLVVRAFLFITKLGFMFYFIY